MENDELRRRNMNSFQSQTLNNDSHKYVSENQNLKMHLEQIKQDRDQLKDELLEHEEVEGKLTF